MLQVNKKPYTPISQFYRQRFGGRVQKISVSLAEDCPNRQGLKGMQTCVFCDAWGSAGYPEFRKESLITQIEQIKMSKRSRTAAHKFIVYFQAYTNTFLRLQKLEESFSAALNHPEVVGLAVGTRPDCISQGVLNLWGRIGKSHFLSVELGVQSFFEDQLHFLRRGHSAQDTIGAINRIKAETNVDLGIHLIFGIPGETDAHILETAKIVSDLPIDNVKLHNLHVLKNTPLETMHQRGEFTPVELPEYTRRVILFLEHLPSRIYVQRLAATSNRWDELISPEWTKHHMRVHQYIIDTMIQTGAQQGKQVSLASDLCY